MAVRNAGAALVKRSVTAVYSLPYQFSSFNQTRRRLSDARLLCGIVSILMRVIGQPHLNI